MGDLKSENWKEKIIDLIRDSRNFVEKPKPAYEVAKEKIALLFLGDTGEGKSTHFCILLNHKLEIYEYYGKYRIRELGEDLRIGQGRESMTNSSDIQGFNKLYTIIDTPGFNHFDVDSNPIIEAYNQLKVAINLNDLNKVLPYFKATKLLLFLGRDKIMNNKAQYVNDFVKVFAEWLPSFDKFKSSATLLITRARNDDKEEHLIQHLEDHINFLTQQSRKSVNGFFNHIINEKNYAISYEATKEDFSNPENFFEKAKKLTLGKIGYTLSNTKSDKEDFKFSLKHETKVIVKQIFEEKFDSNKESNKMLDFYNKIKQALKPFVKVINIPEPIIKDHDQIIRKLINIGSESLKIDESTKSALDLIELYDLYQYALMNNLTEEIIRHPVIIPLNDITGILNLYVKWQQCVVYINKIIECYKDGALLEKCSSSYTFIKAVSQIHYHKEQNIINYIIQKCDNEFVDASSKSLSILQNEYKDTALSIITSSLIQKLDATYVHKDPCKFTKAIITSDNIIDFANKNVGCSKYVLIPLYGIDLDESLPLPGKDLIIISPYLYVKSNVNINLSGKDPIIQIKALCDKVGQDGVNGENSGSIYINIKDSKIEDSQLSVFMNGGNGQNGQDGGDGCPGADGKKIDYYYDFYKTAKTKDKKPVSGCIDMVYFYQNKGENGHDGRCGGSGGQGGYRGHKIIKNVPQNNIHSITKQGSKGKNGDDGKGGPGGKDSDILEVTYEVCKSQLLWDLGEKGGLLGPLSGVTLTGATGAVGAWIGGTATTLTGFFSAASATLTATAATYTIPTVAIQGTVLVTGGVLSVPFATVAVVAGGALGVGYAGYNYFNTDKDGYSYTYKSHKHIPTNSKADDGENANCAMHISDPITGSITGLFNSKPNFDEYSKFEDVSLFIDEKMHSVQLCTTGANSVCFVD